MTRLLLVASGGALGASLRYGASVLAGRLAPGAAWPWGTFAVNVLGGALMGVLVGWLAARSAGDEGLRLFLAVGVLGGFTTFSAFSLEVVAMLERRDWTMAAGYVAASVLLSVAALLAGLVMARRLFGAAA
ncbi:MAG: fluoride efflux transporter CrcB [Brevundimonas sp.]